MNNRLREIPLNTFIKITTERGYTKLDDGTYVVKLNRYTEKFDLYEFGHPMNVNTLKCDMGLMGQETPGIKKIEPCTPDDIRHWLDSYREFALSIIKSKKYAIEENLSGCQVLSDIEPDGSFVFQPVTINIINPDSQENNEKAD